MDHLSAYAALLTRTMAWLVAASLALVFLGLAGMAVMLGLLQNQFHWVLVVVPGSVLALVAAASLRAGRPRQSERFPELKAQIDSDAQALRRVA